MLFKKYKLRGKIKEMSLIGKSIIELYVAAVCENEVQEIIKNSRLTVVNQDRMSTVHNRELNKTAIAKRIGFLLSRNSIKNLRTCIMEGFSPDIIEEALQYENEFRLPSSLRGDGINGTTSNTPNDTNPSETKTGDENTYDNHDGEDL